MTTIQQDADRIRKYLNKRAYNTPDEIASDLDLSEADYSLAVAEIDGYRTGVRRDSYGVYVAWIER